MTPDPFSQSAKTAAIIEDVRQRLIAQAAMPAPLTPAERLAAGVTARTRGVLGARAAKASAQAAPAEKPLHPQIQAIHAPLADKEASMSRHPMSQARVERRFPLAALAVAAIGVGCAVLVVAGFLAL